jgi:GTPase Era involved in 16S rRNA processing
MSKAKDDFKYNVVVGAPRMGKSTFLAKTAANYLIRNPHNIVSITETQGTFPFDLIKKICAEKEVETKDRLFYFRARPEQRDIIDDLPPGLAIIDDTRAIFSDDKATELYLFAVNHRHIETNVTLVYHSLAKVHYSLIEVINKIYAFKVLDSYKKVGRRLPDQVTKEFVEAANKLEPYKKIALRLF